MKKILFASLLAILVLTACTGDGSSSIQGGWKLVSYGPAGEQISAVADVETSIVFDAEGQMSGNVGCNGFGGEYSIKDGQIEFGPVMSTMMYCEEVAEQESSTLAVFQETTTFVLDGDTLTITSADGAMSVVLERK